MLRGQAMAAPLAWEVEASARQAPANADSVSLEPGPARSLVWTLETPTKDIATSPATDQVRPPIPALPPLPKGEDLQPNGYPRYGVPVQAMFPPPYIGGAVPSGYIAGWGSYYVGVSGGTPDRLREDGQPDGSFNAGFGLGDFFKTLAVQLDWGVGSVKNLGANGGFSVSAGRLLLDQPRLQLAASGGVLSIYTYGNEPNREPASGFGVLTLATPLRPQQWDFQQVLQFSLGYGGWQFAYLDPVTYEGDTTGFFTALGVQISRNTGLSASWSARGTNVNLSYTPFRDLPIYLNLAGLDVFDASPWGPRAVLSLTWGDDFRTALF